MLRFPLRWHLVLERIKTIPRSAAKLIAMRGACALSGTPTHTQKNKTKQIVTC
jgi:hypothetical protein